MGVLLYLDVGHLGTVALDEPGEMTGGSTTRRQNPHAGGLEWQVRGASWLRDLGIARFELST